ncbi:MAG: hypothetical protein QCI82_08320, partial [Candidatus Thermoplasmatota archaeon]|nr:hypothetical protein [Candidatus Thermoplasmatota archaeon]
MGSYVAKMCIITLSFIAILPALSSSGNSEYLEIALTDFQGLDKDRFFLKNNGFYPSENVFLGRTSFGKVGFTNDGVLYCMEDDDEMIVVKLRFSGCNNIQPEGEWDLPDIVRYGISSNVNSDTRLWAYSRVVYRDVWDRIDLLFYHIDLGLKYDVRIRPGGDIADIEFVYEGTGDLVIDDYSYLFIDEGKVILGESI